MDLVAVAGGPLSPEEAAALLASRPLRDDLAPDPRLPADTRLWAVLQQASGGTWGGCVYDPEAVAARLAGGGTAAIQPSSGSRSAGRP